MTSKMATETWKQQQDTQKNCKNPTRPVIKDRHIAARLKKVAPTVISCDIVNQVCIVYGYNTTDFFKGLDSTATVPVLVAATRRDGGGIYRSKKISSSFNLPTRVVLMYFARINSSVVTILYEFVWQHLLRRRWRQSKLQGKQGGSWRSLNFTMENGACHHLNRTISWRKRSIGHLLKLKPLLDSATCVQNTSAIDD